VTRTVTRHSDRMKKRYGDFFGQARLTRNSTNPLQYEDFVQETSEVDQD
jgi:hypothetical protein